MYECVKFLPPRKTTNLARKGLETSEAVLGDAPVAKRERRPSAVHLHPLVGVPWSGPVSALLFFWRPVLHGYKVLMPRVRLHLQDRRRTGRQERAVPGVQDAIQG